MMANKSMKPRHWERIANVTGHKFDIESDNFLLRDIMAAPLLKFKEDIEVIILIRKSKDEFFVLRIFVYQLLKKKISKLNLIKLLLIGEIKIFNLVPSKLVVNFY
jgi:hypothetical protein